MNEYLIQQDTLVNIANNVRAVTGENKTLSPSEMISSLGLKQMQ